MDVLTVVQEGIDERDNCPVLRRLKGYLVQQGVKATLEHTFRDRTGNPIDLTAYLTPEQLSNPHSDSLSDDFQLPMSGVFLRVKEWDGVGLNNVTNPIWEIEGKGTDYLEGVVQATLSKEIVEQAGIYEASFGLRDSAGDVILVSQTMLSVERSLWAADYATIAASLGPPSINEIRLKLRDSDSADNPLWDDIEFSDVEIMSAITEPVRAWNREPPPIETYTTRNFPWKIAWLDGIIAQLHLMAAHTYRRNRMKTSAGGVDADDMGREQEYMQEGKRRWDEYIQWLRRAKIMANIKKFSGTVPSPYAWRTGW